jgi:TonB family protein
MRRISFALLALTLAASAAAFAQSQDPVLVSARQFAGQGNYDTAISMLRGALTTRPSDAALKTELADVLDMKAAAMSREILKLRSEIAALRGESSQPPRVIAVQPAPFAGCSGTAPVRVGGNIKQPMKTIDVKPAYPPIAQSANVQGIVIVEATLDCQGNVSDAKVLRGQPLLNDAALEAVRQWRYNQTLLNGVPVPVILTVTVTFSMQN